MEVLAPDDARKILLEMVKNAAAFAKFETRFPEIFKLVDDYTQNLPQSITQKIWHYIHSIREVPTCPTDGCDKKLIWRTIFVGYSNFCSSACSNRSGDTKEKTRITMLERYGVEHALQSSHLLSKCRETLLANYGVDSPLKSIEIKAKVYETNISRYGHAEYAATEEFKDARQKTFDEKYGCWNTSAPIIKDKLRQVYLEKTDNEKTIINSKIRLTNLSKYGVDSFSKLTLSKDTISKLENKEYLESLYGSGKSLVGIASDLGCSDCTVGNYFRQHRIELRSGNSAAEIEIGQFLTDHNISFIANDRSLIKKELDILIPDKSLAIEYCGIYWHSELYKGKYYHRDKMLAANEIGIRLITIFEDEWVHSKNIVKDKLLNILGVYDNSSRIYARKCNIVRIDDIRAVKLFYNKTHVQGFASGYLHLALVHDKCIVGMMSFKKESADIVSLVRFSTAVPVLGGFSKLLRHFENTQSYRVIQSFADLRWTDPNNNIYERYGFTAEATIPVDYSYVTGDKRYHKFNYRHVSLSKLPQYDPSLSERDNTRKMGIYRIYDCGKKKYVKSKTCK